jgi:hypothetical protein
MPKKPCGTGIPVLVGELGKDFGSRNILAILLVVFPQQVKHCHRLRVLNCSHLQVVFDIGRSGQGTKYEDDIYIPLSHFSGGIPNFLIVQLVLSAAPHNLTNESNAGKVRFSKMDVWLSGKAHMFQ